LSGEGVLEDACRARRERAALCDSGDDEALLLRRVQDFALGADEVENFLRDDGAAQNEAALRER